MSNIEYRTGDLFDQDDVIAVCHGVNCKGLMGAGIAKVFKDRFPDMFEQYQTRCAFDGLQLGQCLPWWTHDGHVIFNLATQFLPGPHADVHAITEALWSAVWICYQANIDKLAMPRIGAGIGGLEWDRVEAAINEVATDFPEITFIVVTLPEQEQDHVQDSATPSGSLSHADS